MKCKCILCHKRIKCNECLEDNKVVSGEIEECRIIENRLHKETKAFCRHNHPIYCPVLKTEFLNRKAMERAKYKQMKRRLRIVKKEVRDNKHKPQRRHGLPTKGNLTDAGGIKTLKKKKVISVMGCAGDDQEFNIEEELKSIRNKDD